VLHLIDRIPEGVFSYNSPIGAESPILSEDNNQDPEEKPGERSPALPLVCKPNKIGNRIGTFSKHGKVLVSTG
jgi:hypothetical protein